MKRGCFLTFIVIFTLIVGVTVYLYKYKRSIFKNFAKENVAHLVMNDFKNKMATVKPSVYKDSLQSDLNEFLNKNKHLEFDTLMTGFENIIHEARYIIKDHQVDPSEYNQFKKTLMSYERSKKN